MKRVLKGILKTVLGIVGFVVLAAAAFLGCLTIAEYKPADVEAVELRGEKSDQALPLDEEISVMTWNVGYCALGKDADFFMDGGGKAPNASRDLVEKNRLGISEAIGMMDPDICILQEVDVDSSRSYRVDQRRALARGNNAFAINYKCGFVPYPIPPIGRVKSGIFTTSAYEIRDNAARIALPCPFSWPLRIANLKRALLITRMPVEGTGKELVVVNFHLEAYDGGEGKIAQTKKLLEILGEEYSKGNYVIAGGDWNQTFPGSLDVYPNTHEDLWAVGLIDPDSVPDGWTIGYDTDTPTCRLLNQPYDPSDTVNTQYYVIDGFIMSPNVDLKEVKTQDLDFEYSDHNPVVMKVVLKKE